MFKNTQKSGDSRAAGPKLLVAGCDRITAAFGALTGSAAHAAIVYIYVNDFPEAIYFIRGTDSKGALLRTYAPTQPMLDGRYNIPNVQRA